MRAMPSWIGASYDDASLISIASCSDYEYLINAESCWTGKTDKLLKQTFFRFKQIYKREFKNFEIHVGITSKSSFFDNSIDILRSAHFKGKEYMHQTGKSWLGFRQVNCPIKKLAAFAKREASHNMRTIYSPQLVGIIVPDYLHRIEESPFGTADFMGRSDGYCIEYERDRRMSELQRRASMTPFYKENLIKESIKEVQHGYFVYPKGAKPYNEFPYDAVLDDGTKIYWANGWYYEDTYEEYEYEG